MNCFTMTVSEWKSVANKLESGTIRFSTGTMQRMAPGLAEYIRRQTYRKRGTSNLTIDFDDNYDAGMLIHQAS